MSEYRSIAHERERLLEEIKYLPEGVQALEKLKFLREEYDWAIPDYRNSLNILSDTTYEDRKHFLLELIQNADDARYETKSPELTFVMLEEGIELQYNEKGFTVEDVIAITGTGSSTKASKKHNANSFIGEKGIGFKSVFALASEVKIESHPWHFKLYKDKCIVPEIVYSCEANPSEGTRLRIKFTDKAMVDVIYNELLRYVSGEVESFLFLQKLAKFNLIDKRKTDYEIKGIAIYPESRNEDQITLKALPSGNERNYVLYKEELEFSEALVSERWEKIGATMGPIRRNIIAAALLDNEAGENKNGRLFCYLPTEVKLPVPIFLQVDGQTKADRERLHDPENNSWNKYLFANLPKFLTKAILSWRDKPSVGDRLLEFIPSVTGEDQLKQVFEEFKHCLLVEPWVKLLDSGLGWDIPANCAYTDSYLLNWFEKYPNFRSQAEIILGRKIVHPDWCDKVNKRSKLSAYKVNKLSETEIARLLAECKLPKEMLQEDNLIELYSFILDFQILKDNQRETIWRTTIERVKNVKDYLRKAEIYPIKNYGFTSIYNNLDEKVYYIPGDSKLVAGFDKASGIRLIDSEYTFIYDKISEKSTEESEQLNKINERNKAVRDLLSFVAVKELTEFSLLEDIQIPWLLSSLDTDYEQKFNVIIDIFSSYVAKGQNNKDYINKLEAVKEVFFQSETRMSYKLKKLILPRMLRLSKEDNIYDGSGIPAMEIPESKIKFIRSNVELFRKFLIHCGVRYEPKFILNSIRHASASKFMFEDEDKYNLWIKRIGRDYTPMNSVTVQTTLLDPEDTSIIKSRSGNMEALERKIYQLWEKRFSEAEIDCDTYYFRKPVLPGYFTASYIRKEKRTILLKDTNWAGLEEGIMPIRTAKGLIISCSSAFYTQTLNKSYLTYLLYFMPAVIVKGRNETSEGYMEAYVKSLGIRRIQLSDLNMIWNKVEESRYNDILSLAVELKLKGCSYEDFKVYDKNTHSLRDIHEFRLGGISSDSTPLIAIQYGEVGEALGKLFKLKEYSTAKAYSGIFKDIFINQNKSDEVLKKFYHLLMEWCSWNAVDKGLIAQELQDILKLAGYVHDPLVVFNDDKMYNTITDAGIKAVLLNVDTLEKDRYILEKSALELGFMLPESLGEMKTVNEAGLSDEESAEYKRLFELYKGMLEPLEISRLNLELMSVGGSYSICNNIIKADTAYRGLKDTPLRVNVELPYIDYKSHRIIVSKWVSAFKTIEDILVLIEFTTRRNASRDIEEIKKTYLAEIRKSELKNNSQERTISLQPDDGGVVINSHKIPSTEKEVPQNSSSSTIEQTEKKIKNISAETSTSQIIGDIKNSLKASDTSSAVEDSLSWNTGLSPEEEEELRGNLVPSIKKSLEEGPSVYSKKYKRNKRVVYALDGRELSMDEKIIDDNSINPKEFLLAEYGGKCQVCGTELTFGSGQKWISVYHIMKKQEGAWWADRPFNIIGMCPNCCTMAQHGGQRDFSGIFTEAETLLDGGIFPEEVAEFKGDYYIVDIMFNGESKRLKMSKVHLNYFAALLESDESAAEVKIEDQQNDPAHSLLPDDSSEIKNLKEQFLSFITKMGMAYSYKPVLMLAMLNKCDKLGKAEIEDIADYFTNYYEIRRFRGLVVEDTKSMFAYRGYSRKKVISNILTNPFEKFERLGFLKKGNKDGVLEFDEMLWLSLTEFDKKWIKEHCKEKLEEYYNKLN